MQNSNDGNLYRIVDEVLHYIWDPIGVAGEPRARGEYHAYLPDVFALVRDGSGAEEIAGVLRSIATKQMGFTPTAESENFELKVAHVLLSWKDMARRSPSTLEVRLPPMPA